MQSTPEKLFVIVSLIIGIMFILVTPMANWVSWDSETHYKWALNQSYVDSVFMTEADKDFVRPYVHPTFNLLDTANSINKYNDIYQQGDVQVTSNEGFDRFVQTIAHWPSGLFMSIARGIGFSFYGIYVFGKLGILVTYTSLIYLALKRLRAGKMLMSAIAWMPVPFFLATNYSYDYWMIAWFMLGFSCYFSEIQKKNSKISNRTIALMLISMLMAILPKQPYLPMILPLFFMNRSKFINNRQYKYYLLSIFLIIIIAIGTFLFIRVNEVGVGDLRGGETVDVSQQMQMILGNLPGFIKMMLRYLIGYTSYESTNSSLSFMAHLGNPTYSSYSMALLIIIALTDKPSIDLGYSSWRYRMLLFLGVGVTLFAVASALYVAFTPVGADTVLGCQPRYLLPLLFPVLFAIAPSKMENKMNLTNYHYIVYITMVIFLLYSIWDRTVSLYF